MKGILTDDDKKYLRRVSNYLKSLGIQYGNIEIALDEVGWGDIKWDEITHFSNNYTADVPEGLILILKKITNYIAKNNLGEVAGSELEWYRGEFDIDTVRQEITVSEYWTEYGNNDVVSEEFEDEPELFENINLIIEETEKQTGKKIKVPKELTINFEGSGDSGYLNDNFENTILTLPASIEDWCYQTLENGFGGWEMNEGSSGNFVFDLKEKTITLNYYENVEIGRTNSIYEESFSN
jgi:hypothetical protein